jgi:hypothetical protein
MLERLGKSSAPNSPAKSLGIGKRRKNEKTKQSIKQRSMAFVLGIGSKRSDELIVGDARRTCRDTPQTTEAFVNVRKSLVEVAFPLENFFHEKDATAGRIHFVAKFEIGRARRQTEPAMNARLHGMSHWLTQRPQLLGRNLMQQTLSPCRRRVHFFFGIGSQYRQTSLPAGSRICANRF